MPITVRNLTNVDFGSYAADGLPDPWQVQYFGESGLQTAAGRNAEKGFSASARSGIESE